MNFRNFFNKYLKDSYGWDKLSSFVLIFGLLLSSISRWILPAGAALIIWAIWRSLSKNKYKRYQEEEAYESYLSMINHKIRGWKTNFSEGRNYKILSCPNCAQKLRVPRHKGKITITCKNCHNEFKAKS